jgi:hypothetical protein
MPRGGGTLNPSASNELRVNFAVGGALLVVASGFELGADVFAASSIS